MEGMFAGQVFKILQIQAGIIRTGKQLNNAKNSKGSKQVGCEIKDNRIPGPRNFDRSNYTHQQITCVSNPGKTQQTLYVSLSDCGDVAKQNCSNSNR